MTFIRNQVVDPGSTTPKLTPEVVKQQLRDLRSQIEEVTPLTKQQRKVLKQMLRDQTIPVVNASINVIGVLDNVSQAVGTQLDDVRQVQDEALRWDEVESEARAFVHSIEGANLIRRQRLALIGRQAYSIGTQLALDPANAVLVPHVEEVKQLKAVVRRKKTKKTPETPHPTPTPSTHPTTPSTTTTPQA